MKNPANFSSEELFSGARFANPIMSSRLIIRQLANGKWIVWDQNGAAPVGREMNTEAEAERDLANIKGMARSVDTSRAAGPDPEGFSAPGEAFAGPMPENVKPAVYALGQAASAARHVNDHLHEALDTLRDSGDVASAKTHIDSALGNYAYLERYMRDLQRVRLP